MRLVAAGFAYTTAVMVIFAVGAAAIGDLHSAGAKQKRELDAAIDQIVEQHKERRALMAKADTSERHAAAETTGSAAREGKSPAARSTARRTMLALEENNPEAKAGDQKSEAEAKTQKRQRQVRSASGRQHFLPFGFASLPKFTAYTLLGLVD